MGEGRRRGEEIFMYSKHQSHVARPLLWFPCFQNGCCPLVVGSGYVRLTMFGYKAHICTYVSMYVRIYPRIPTPMGFDRNFVLCK